MTATRPEITIHLMGGLGNQLFQYAFGRRLALANHARLYLDASGYAANTGPEPARGLRACGLSHFNIAGTFIEIPLDQTGLRPSLERKWRKILPAVRRCADLTKPYYRRREIVEPKSNYARFDQRVYDRIFTGSISVRGFWQSERYFADIEAVLRPELTLRHDLQGRNAELADKIFSTDSVAVHVRHGDNATTVAPTLGVLARSYFETAVQAISRAVPAPEFFVFSDDIPWAKDFLALSLPTAFVEGNGPTDAHEDLRLMSFCKHHIIANSTFGWWGAWLGRKDGQIVYAPRRYYQNIDRPNPDLYPAAWRLI